MLRPGTDAALAVALMHVLFSEGFADRDYMARHADAPEELERHVAGRTPEWAAEITGVPAETIKGGSDPRVLFRAILALHDLKTSAQGTTLSCDTFVKYVQK